MRCVFCFFFFFSSRRRHTRFDCDWSSDVCSSDLEEPEHLALADAERHVIDGAPAAEDLAQVADLDRGRTAHRRPLPWGICSMSYRTAPTRYPARRAPDKSAA